MEEIWHMEICPQQVILKIWLCKKDNSKGGHQDTFDSSKGAAWMLCAQGGYCIMYFISFYSKEGFLCVF